MTLQQYEKKREERIKRVIKLMEAGVEFADIDTAFIGEDVKIGPGTYIGPCVTLEGNTEIGENCKILQNTRINDGKVGDRTVIESSVILESSVGSDTSVGPFAYIRPGSKVGSECKVGDFVELKNATLGNGTKSAHLTYIGDADVGEKVNFGCGVVLVNYDGTKKYRSEIGDGCFVGCNVNLVSPVKIGDRAYLAAGSTITEDVPEDALAIARSRQTNIEKWAEKSGLYRK